MLRLSKSVLVVVAGLAVAAVVVAAAAAAATDFGKRHWAVVGTFVVAAAAAVRWLKLQRYSRKVASEVYSVVQASDEPPQRWKLRVKVA